jgi:hypothetical protein
VGIIETSINIELTEAGLYLVCLHATQDLAFKDKTQVAAGIYNVEEYFADAVMKYCDVAKERAGETVFREKADVPFLPERRSSFVSSASSCY